MKKMIIIAMMGLLLVSCAEMTDEGKKEYKHRQKIEKKSEEGYFERKRNLENMQIDFCLENGKNFRESGWDGQFYCID